MLTVKEIKDLLKKLKEDDLNIKNTVSTSKFYDKFLTLSEPEDVNLTPEAKVSFAFKELAKQQENAAKGQQK